MRNDNVKCKKKKKNSAASKLFFFMLFLIVVLIAAIFAVKFNTPKTKSVQVYTKIVNGETMILDYPITVIAENPTAANAFETGCNQKGISYKLENGMFDGFDNVFSTNSDGWLFYVNGTIASVGAEEYVVNEGDTVEFRYANYSSEFSMPVQSTPENESEIGNENAVPVKIKIYASDKVLIESTVSADENAADAQTALQNMCDAKNALYTIENGHLTSYGEYSTNENNEWVFYINGNISKETLDKQPIKAGDVLEFKFEIAE